MKDLAVMMITLGLIMFAMMFAQQRYYSQEAEVNQKWQQERHFRPATPSPTPSVTPSAVP